MVSKKEPTKRQFLKAGAAASLSMLFDSHVASKAADLSVHDDTPQVAGFTLEQARAFAERAVDLDVSKLLRPEHDGCVDGRQSDDIGIHSPGAHYGYFIRMCALRKRLQLETAGSVSISHDVLLEALRRTIGDFKHFRYHATCGGCGLSGCGYIESVHKNPPAFGVDENDIAYIDTFVAQRRVVPYEVHGPHEERAIFRVVHLDDIGVSGKQAVCFNTSVARDGLEEHAFVYQETFVEETRINRLADALHDLYAERLGRISEGKIRGILCEIEGDHARQTFRILAPRLIKNGSVYKVVIEDRQIKTIIPSRWFSD